MHTKTKHIRIKYNYPIELIQYKEVRLKYANTKELIEEIFTKELHKDAFMYLRGKLGVIPLFDVH